jgi:hypothetical protein
MKFVSPAFALLAFPLVVAAQSGASYDCSLGEVTRRVVVERAGSAPVPCDVAYYKDSEAPGEREVLWSAENDPQYCGARATEFVARLGELGWACSMAGTAAGNENDGN